RFINLEDAEALLCRGDIARPAGSVDERRRDAAHHVRACPVGDRSQPYLLRDAAQQPGRRSLAVGPSDDHGPLAQLSAELPNNIRVDTLGDKPRKRGAATEAESAGNGGGRLPRGNGSGALNHASIVGAVRRKERGARLQQTVIPSSRGGPTLFGAIGPVACLSAYRRQGHVGKLLRLALERMREQGIPLSGLFTPHDALYARFGWERSEARKQYYLRPSDIRLRVKGAPGVIESVAPDDWGRLDAIYRRYAGPRNGPLHRVEPWWRQNVLRHYDEMTAGLGDNDAFVWKSANREDEGYVSYYSRAMPRTDRYAPWEVLVRDFVSLSGDAYLGLWRHLLAHDIATRLAVHLPVEDPFADLVEDPRKIELPRAEGPM